MTLFPETDIIVTEIRHGRMDRRSIAEGKMRKTFWICCIFTVLFLGSCGYAEIREDRIEIRQDGTVRAVSYGDFPSDRYDIAALREEAEEAAEEYNLTAGEEKITFKEAVQDGDHARVVIYYDSPEDYEAFNHVALSVRPLEEALASDSEIGNVGMRSAEGTKRTTLSSIPDPAEGEEYILVCVSEPLRILYAGEPVFFSGTANVDADGTVTVSFPDTVPEEERRAYIVYKLV